MPDTIPIQVQENEIDFLILATKYYVSDKSPSMERPLPSREEVLEVMKFSDVLFRRVCQKLHIDPELLK